MKGVGKTFQDNISHFLDQDIEGIAQMASPRVKDRRKHQPFTFGTIFGEVEAIQTAWGGYQHGFAVEAEEVRDYLETVEFRKIQRITCQQMRPFRNIDALVVTPSARAVDRTRKVDSWVLALFHNGSGAWKIFLKVIMLVSLPADVLYQC